MPEMTKKYISWMLSALMCFNSSFTVIQAEEETPDEDQKSQEVIEEHVEEIAEVTEQEDSQEDIAEETTEEVLEEETGEEKDLVTEVVSEDEENLEAAEQDPTEIKGDEIWKEEAYQSMHSILFISSSPQSDKGTEGH